VTLKARLAAMMILLLVAVVALQALLTHREQQTLERRLADLRQRIDSSTRFLTEQTLELVATDEFVTPGDSAHVSVVHHFSRSGPDSAGGPRQLKMVVDGDTTVVEVEGDGEIPPGRWLPEHPRLARLLEEIEACGPVLDAEVRGEDTWIDANGDTVRATRQLMRRTPADSDSEVVRLFFASEGPRRIAVSDSLGEVLRVHVAMPGGGPQGSIELLYPVADLTAELAEARRRSWLWLAGLLAVGAVGAVALAVQFTRPIRALESSFGEVEHGNLDVRVDAERPDEIGRLTRSFNTMVTRLRASREMEGRLAESERLAAVGRLAAGVAHEVRNPLNAMRLTIGQLRAKAAPEGEEERERFDRYTELVDGELGRLETLVGTFLDLARTEDIARDRLDVADSLGASVALFRQEAEARGIRVEHELEAPLPVRGDAGRLPTVWNNLLANALQATPEGGTIRVTGRRESGSVVVTVADDGPGIAPEDLPRIWEPFFSGRRDGTGLGLALVRSITEAHGGTADAESRPGRGTTMTVRLPEETEGESG
jgi:signal transduction histidine kinase